MRKLEIIRNESGSFGIATQSYGINYISLPEVLKKVSEFCIEELKPEIYCPPKDTLVDMLDKDGNVVAMRYATGEKSKDGISIYTYNDGATSITQCGCSVQNRWRITPGYWIKFNGNICPVNPETRVNTQEKNCSMSGNVIAKNVNWANKSITEFKVISYP